MSDCRTIDVVNAIVARLNAPPTPFAQSFVAVRGYRPIYDLKDYKSGLRVTVIAKTLEETLLNRNQVDSDIEIDVAVQNSVSGDADCDRLMLIVEQVKQALEGILGLVDSPYANASWVKTHNSPIYSPMHLQKFGVFTSIITFTFKARRAR